MQLALPLCRPELSLDNIRHAPSGSNEIGFINNSPIKNIFVFKLNANSKHQSVHDKATFAQETKRLSRAISNCSGFI